VILALVAVTASIRARADEPTTFDQRQTRLQDMSDAEKHALLEKKRLFDQLSDEEQSQLRQLHQALVRDPDHDRLRVTLERYNAWLRGLPPGERAQLISLPADQRLARIREIMRGQEMQRFRMLADGSLSKEDKLVIQRWLNAFIEANEDKCLEALGDGRFRKKLMECDSERRKLILSAAIWRPGSDMPRPSAEDREQLSQSLSREARDLLSQAPDDQARNRTLDRWIGAATFSRMWRQPSFEQLEEFAKTLDGQQREFLESLPREKMYDELRKLYYRARFPDRGRGDGFRRPGRGHGDRPPGPPGGPPGGERRRRGGSVSTVQARQEPASGAIASGPEGR
jgi:hypothetical protein